MPKSQGIFELNLAKYKNSKLLFSCINHKLKISGIEALLKDGSITYDKRKITNTLNKQFESVFSNVVSLAKKDFARRTTSVIDKINISVTSIVKMILCSDPHRSLGYDSVNPYFLKKALVAFAEPLRIILQNLLNNS